MPLDADYPYGGPEPGPMPRERQAVVAASVPAAEYGDLQRLVDELFRDDPKRYVSKLDVLMRADIDDLSEDLREVIDLLPSGRYARHRLCDQMNSIITAHGWGYTYGTVE